MRTSHKERMKSIPDSSWQKLRDFLEKRRTTNEPMEDFSKFEKKLHELICGVER